VDVDTFVEFGTHGFYETFLIKIKRKKSYVSLTFKSRMIYSLRPKINAILEFKISQRMQF
jgi:hypothetical protein